MNSTYLRKYTFAPRSLFYLIGPEEVGIYKHAIHSNPKISNTAGTLFSVCIISELLYLVFIKKQRIQFSDLVCSVTQGLFMLMVRFSGIVDIIKIPYYYVYENYRLFDLESYEIFGVPFFETWYGWCLVLLCVDFSYYLYHRVCHEVNFLWAFHQTHHSSQHYKLSTALRQSAGNNVACPNWAWDCIFAIAGIPPVQLLIHYDLNLIYQFWIHTEIINRLPFGLEYILNTPSHHRVHHGRNKFCIDKNYRKLITLFI